MVRNCNKKDDDITATAFTFEEKRKLEQKEYQVLAKHPPKTTKRYMRITYSIIATKQTVKTKNILYNKKKWNNPIEIMQNVWYTIFVIKADNKMITGVEALRITQDNLYNRKQKLMQILNKSV